MSTDSESFDKDIRKHSKKLAELGMDLSKIMFSYKVEYKPTKEYWMKRIENFKKYKEIAIKYYNQAFLLIGLVNEEESKLFLMHISKFHQLGSELIEIMNKIIENPSIMDKKDKQQSKWSKKIRNQIIEQSDECLILEKEINFSFRTFYDKNLKQTSEK